MGTKPLSIYVRFRGGVNWICKRSIHGDSPHHPSIQVAVVFGSANYAVAVHMGLPRGVGVRVRARTGR